MSKLDEIKARDANREWAVNDACEDRHYLLGLVDEMATAISEHLAALAAFRAEVTVYVDKLQQQVEDLEQALKGKP